MPVTRARADRMVAELGCRAETINVDPRYNHLINRVAVFGSYLTYKPTLGDLDTAIDYCFRDPLWPDSARKQFNCDIPPPDYIRSEFILRLGWPEIKLRRDFRIGRGMKVHEFGELRLLGCDFRVVWERDGVKNEGAIQAHSNLLTELQHLRC